MTAEKMTEPHVHHEATKVAIIGGGWAGFATAVEIADAGIPVTVFEAASNLGGRARGFSRQGMQLDNGQHILLGAYRETLRLMRKVGIAGNHALKRLPLRLETPGHFELATPHLPAPLHLLAGLLTAQGLDCSERIAALRLIARLRLTGFKLVQDISVADLLSGQPEKLVRLLWEPLCLAALNTPIRHASAQIFLNVLRDSFSKARADSDLLLPCVDLSALFPQAAAAYIAKQGGAVRLSTTVSTIEPVADGVIVDSELFSHAVCAVAPHALPRLLSHLPEMAVLLAMAEQFSYQPIATVYLQYPEDISLSFPMQGLVGGLGQWVFDRGALCGQHGLLAVVISAEGPHLRLEHQTLAATIHEELKIVLKSLPPPRWQQVIVEKRATFACTTGLQRPSQATVNNRIFIAGDYTAGDYPATLEGAVRSGVQCATLLNSRVA